MKRYILWTTFALAAIALVLIPSVAMAQEGYISGETLRNLEKPDEFLVISTWQSSQDWKTWLASKDRKEIQSKIDKLLGGETSYEVYHYGFTG